MDINRNPNGTFEEIVSGCIEIIDNSEAVGVPKNSNQKVENFLYSELEKRGIVYISKSIWED